MSRPDSDKYIVSKRSHDVVQICRYVCYDKNAETCLNIKSNSKNDFTATFKQRLINP